MDFNSQTYCARLLKIMSFNTLLLYNLSTFFQTLYLDLITATHFFFLIMIIIVIKLIIIIIIPDFFILIIIFIVKNIFASFLDITNS